MVSGESLICLSEAFSELRKAIAEFCRSLEEFLLLENAAVQAEIYRLLGHPLGKRRRAKKRFFKYHYWKNRERYQKRINGKFKKEKFLENQNI